MQYVQLVNTHIAILMTFQVNMRVVFFAAAAFFFALATPLGLPFIYILMGSSCNYPSTSKILIPTTAQNQNNYVIMNICACIVLHTIHHCRQYITCKKVWVMRRLYNLAQPGTHGLLVLLMTTVHQAPFLIVIIVTYNFIISWVKSVTLLERLSAVIKAYPIWIFYL